MRPWLAALLLCAAPLAAQEPPGPPPEPEPAREVQEEAAERPSRVAAAILCDIRRGEEDEDSTCYPAMAAAFASKPFRQGWLSTVGAVASERAGIGGAWTPRKVPKLSAGLLLTIPYGEGGINADEWRVTAAATAGWR